MTKLTVHGWLKSKTDKVLPYSREDMDSCTNPQGGVADEADRTQIHLFLNEGSEGNVGK